MEAGLTIPDIVKGLGKYGGTARRFEIIGEVKGVTIVDDYAHHPREITATLKAARRMWPNRRIIIVFQPHLYSRTRDFMQEFAESLADFDAIILTDIYPAREKPIPGVTMEEMMRRVSNLTKTKMLLFLEDKRHIAEELKPILHEGDVVMTVGAGDIDEVGVSLYRMLGEE
jgi:UDP-N-acetylmuramate--alanine ligase